MGSKSKIWHGGAGALNCGAGALHQTPSTTSSPLPPGEPKLCKNGVKIINFTWRSRGPRLRSRGPKWAEMRGSGAGPRRAPAYFNHCPPPPPSRRDPLGGQKHASSCNTRNHRKTIIVPHPFPIASRTAESLMKTISSVTLRRSYRWE